MQLKTKFFLHWPLIVALLIYSIIILGGYAYSLTFDTNHHFVYGVDDAYIHMAMAKNFALHGVWGVTPFQFTQTSSSVLWTLFLAGFYYIFGVSEYTPFILNILASLSVITLSYYILRTYELSSHYVFIVLCLIIFASPLPVLTFFGMEHIWHLFLMILYAFFAARMLSTDNENTASFYALWLLILTPILIATRYESFSIIAIMVFLAVLKRKYTFAGLICFLALLPSILFGLFAFSMHGWIIPTTAIKLRTPIASLLYLIKSGEADVIILFLFLIAGLLLYVQRTEKHSMWERRQIALTVAVGCIICQALVMPSGWFLRYGAYITGINILILGFCLKEWFAEFIPNHPRRLHAIIAKVLIIIVFAFPLAFKAAVATKIIAPASKNIYDQQYQMAKFVKQFYPDGTIACNDIGAISFFNDNIHIVDLAGLATSEFAYERLMEMQTHQGNIPFFEEQIIKQNVDVIMIYESWFEKDISPKWIKVGGWEALKKVVLGDVKVSIFAPDASKKDKLIENLKQFAPELPKDVIQSGLYTS